MITPDFTETQDNLGPGEYTFRIVKGELGEWPAKEDRPAIKHIKWEFETCDEDDSKNNGRKTWDRTAIQGKGAFRLKDLADAADVSVTDGFEIEDFIGKEVKAVLVQNDKYVNIQSYAKLG